MQQLSHLPNLPTIFFLMAKMLTEEIVVAHAFIAACSKSIFIVDQVVKGGRGNLSKEFWGSGFLEASETYGIREKYVGIVLQGI